MFVYRDEKGRITDVTGSVNHAELERLKKEYGEVELGKAKGESTVEFSSTDEASLAALEEAKAPEPVREPPEEENFKSKSEFKSALDSSEDSDGLPKASDTKATWVDYAVSQGSDRDEAESMTKQELVDFYTEEG